MFIHTHLFLQNVTRFVSQICAFQYQDLFIVIYGRRNWVTWLPNIPLCIWVQILSDLYYSFPSELSY